MLLQREGRSNPTMLAATETASMFHLNSHSSNFTTTKRFVKKITCSKASACLGLRSPTLPLIPTVQRIVFI